MTLHRLAHRVLRSARAVHRGGVMCLLVALGACGTAHKVTPTDSRRPAASLGPGVEAIADITLERDCFGCATGSVLVLRRDGTASWTRTGKIRHGTQDRLHMGTIRREDFEALAGIALSRGFFALDDTYEDRQVRDGAWSRTSITLGNELKQVWRSNGAGPAVLREIEAAIEAVQVRIVFVAASP